MLTISLSLALIHMPSIVLSTAFNWILQSRILDQYISFWALKLSLFQMVSSLHNGDISWISWVAQRWPMPSLSPLLCPLLMLSLPFMGIHCPILLNLGVQWVLCNISLWPDLTFPLQLIRFVSSCIVPPISIGRLSSVYYAISSTLFLMVSFSQRAHHPCWKPTLMLTGLAALMTENQPVATVYFLAPI